MEALGSQHSYAQVKGAAVKVWIGAKRIKFTIEAKGVGFDVAAVRTGQYLWAGRNERTYRAVGR